MSDTLVYRALTESDEFQAYSQRFCRWMEGDRADGDRDLLRAGHRLHDEVRRLGMQPEHALIALHASGAPGRQCGTLANADDAPSRYAEALELLTESSPEPMLSPRLVRAPKSGDVWLVILVQESRRWDTKVGPYRKDWLACVAAGDRRYITPVPAGWQEQSDVELLGAITRARPDLRGPLQW